MTTPRITDADVAFFREQGYLVVNDVIPPEKIVALRALSDQFVAGASALTQSNDVLDLDPAHTPQNPKVRRIHTPHKLHDLFRALASDPAILGVVNSLIGLDLRLHGSKLNLKSAHDGVAVQWHQDWSFYPHTNDDMLAIGVPLDDCGLENGPLMVVPGTHRGPIYDHHENGYFVGAFDPGRAGLDASNALPLLVKTGSITAHHVRLVHGSAVNRSDRQRRLMLFEYAAGDAWPLYQDAGTYEDLLAMVIAGSLSLEPRMVALPVRMPYPSPSWADTIYETQKSYTGADIAAR